MNKPQTHTLQATDANAGEGKDVGRPTTFNEATAFIICERIAGGETLSQICKTPGIPARQTVHKWRRKFESFDDSYRQARVDQMESWSDDIVEISDDDTMDTMDSVDKQGNSIQVANHANVQRDRLRVSTRQFLMAKIAPMYADKVDHKHSGEVGHKHTVELSDRERMRRLATFMLEDRAAGVTIEGQIEEQPASSPIVAGDVGESQPEKVPAQTAQASPADIIQGVNGSPTKED